MLQSKYNMKKYLLVLLIVFSYSCQPKTVEKDGGIIITINILTNNPSESELSKTLDILRKRIDYFCFYNPGVNLNHDKRTVEIKLPLMRDTTLFKDFVIKKGELQFLETFENKDIYPCFLEINKEVLKSHKFDDLIVNDSMPINNEFPFFRILSPAMTIEGKLFKGPVVGYSKLKDTALVYQVLKNKELNSFLPVDCEFKWSKIKSGKIISLTAAKKPGNYPTILPQMIKEVHTVEVSDNVFDVNFSLKSEYSHVWSEMTLRNIGKSIAIVIDDEVLSSPVVTSQITNGMSVISSDLTLNQAKALEATLKYGTIPLDFKIEKIDFISIP